MFESLVSLSHYLSSQTSKKKEMREKEEVSKMRFSIKTVRQGTQIVVFKHKFLSRVSANTGETAAGRSYREGHSRAHQHRVDAGSPRWHTRSMFVLLLAGLRYELLPLKSLSHVAIEQALMTHAVHLQSICVSRFIQVA